MSRESQKAWRDRNPEKVKDIKKRWRENNPEKVKKHRSDYYKKNKSSKVAYAREWVKKNPRKLLAAQLRREYGISLEFYDAMVREQCGKCAICEKPMVGPKEPCVDHDHATSDVRELLCSDCNKALGFLRDSPELLLRARDYLLRHRNRS